MESEIISTLDCNAYDDTKRAEKELRKAKNRIAELDRLFQAFMKIRSAVTFRKETSNSFLPSTKQSR